MLYIYIYNIHTYVSLYRSERQSWQCDHGRGSWCVLESVGTAHVIDFCRVMEIDSTVLPLSTCRSVWLKNLGPKLCRLF